MGRRRRTAVLVRAALVVAAVVALLLLVGEPATAQRHRSRRSHASVEEEEPDEVPASFAGDLRVAEQVLRGLDRAERGTQTGPKRMMHEPSRVVRYVKRLGDEPAEAEDEDEAEDEEDEADDRDPVAEDRVRRASPPRGGSAHPAAQAEQPSSSEAEPDRDFVERVAPGLENILERYESGSAGRRRDGGIVLGGRRAPSAQQGSRYGGKKGEEPESSGDETSIDWHRGFLDSLRQPDQPELGGGKKTDARMLLVVMISGWRYDYLPRYYVPNLQKIALRGVRTSLTPVFPASSWPIWWSLATGLRVEQHGVFDGSMFDLKMHAVFDARRESDLRDPRWFPGVPFWGAAQSQNVTTAMLWWPGAQAGQQPSYLKPWHAEADADDRGRVRAVLSLLDMPASERPRLLGVYLGAVGGTARRHGPAAWQTVRAAEHVDQQVGALLDGLAQRGLENTTDIVVIGDHGFTSMNRASRAIYLDDFLDLSATDVLSWTPFVQLRPKEDRPELLENVTSTEIPHLRFYRRETLPVELHATHPRLCPLVGLPDSGYFVTSHAAEAAGTGPGSAADEDGLVEDTGLEPNGRDIFGGDGFGPSDISMSGALLAAGPSIRLAGARVPAVPATSVSALVCHLLDLPTGTGSGKTPIPKWLARTLR